MRFFIPWKLQTSVARIYTCFDPLRREAMKPDLKGRYKRKVKEPSV